jgi:hypothetical protein
MEVICFKCQKVNTSLSKIGRRDECLECKSDLHTCRNCEFYDVKSYNECRETSAEMVKEKERANYCDFFSPGQKGAKAVDEKARLKAAADALFKK